MPKPPSKIIAIDSHRSDPPPPGGGAVKRINGRRFYSDPVTRRNFMIMFFAMGMDWWKACRESRCLPSAASEEMRESMYEHWRRDTGRAA